MGVYCEITLLPNPEVNLNFLWSKVYQQIHLGLVEMQTAPNQVAIGVSFPEYRTEERHRFLGSKLRLVAKDEPILVQFDTNRWLSRLSDYVHCTSIRPVPEKIIGYANYQRVQPKTNKERLARRYAKRHSISYEAALDIYSGMPLKPVSMPFIRLKSLSGGETFCLWINKTPVTASPSSEIKFNTYGLSAINSVPEF